MVRKRAGGVRVVVASRTPSWRERGFVVVDSSGLSSFRFLAFHPSLAHRDLQARCHALTPPERRSSALARCAFAESTARMKKGRPILRAPLLRTIRAGSSYMRFCQPGG